MNNTKSPKNVSLKNQLELWLFCALIGAVAGDAAAPQVEATAGVYIHASPGLVLSMSDFSVAGAVANV